MTSVMPIASTRLRKFARHTMRHGRAADTGPGYWACSVWSTSNDAPTALFSNPFVDFIWSETTIGADFEGR